MVHPVVEAYIYRVFGTRQENKTSRMYVSEFSSSMSKHRQHDGEISLIELLSGSRLKSQVGYIVREIREEGVYHTCKLGFKIL